MSKRITIAILLLVCVFTLTACKSTDYGTVTDKQYTPARQVYSPLVMVVNKHPRIIPRYIYHPQMWQIYVQNEDGGEWWSVAEDYFNSVNIGDFVDRRNIGEKNAKEKLED